MNEPTPSFRDRRRGLKKPIVFIIGIIFGIGCLLGRHYVVNAPIWLWRAARADHSDFYLGKTNGMANRTWAIAARRYLSEVNKVEYSGRILSSSEYEALGVHLDPKWFSRHHPDSIDFNAFVPESVGNVAVTWIYAPGCERVSRDVSSHPRSDWFDLQGRPCLSTFAVTVYMTSEQRLTNIRVAPISSK